MPGVHLDTLTKEKPKRNQNGNQVEGQRNEGNGEGPCKDQSRMGREGGERGEHGQRQKENVGEREEFGEEQRKGQGERRESQRGRIAIC